MKRVTLNYLDLVRAYYKLGLHHYLSSNERHLFLGLLDTFNNHCFPTELKISNSEVVACSALPIRTVIRYREKLIQYLYNPSDTNSWILHYTSGSTRDYGIYAINYTFILTEFSKKINANLALIKNRKSKSVATSKSTEKISASVALIEEGISAKNVATFQRSDPSLEIHDKFGTLSNTIPDNINNPSDKRFHDIFTKIKRICPTYPPNKNLEKANANIESISTFSDEEIDSAIAKTYEKVKTKAVNAFGIDGYILSILNNKSVYASNQSRQITDSVPPIVDPIESAFKDFDILMNQVFDYKNFLEFGDFPDNVNIYIDGWVDTGKDLLAKPGFRLFLAENHPDMLEAFTKILELVERGA